MGRSKRKSAIPEALRQLGEEGLPKDYDSYWYGERSGEAAQGKRTPGIHSKDQKVALLYPLLINARFRQDKEGESFYLWESSSDPGDIATVADLLTETSLAEGVSKLYRSWRKSVDPKVLEEAESTLRDAYPGGDTETILMRIWAGALSVNWIGQRKERIESALPNMDYQKMLELSRSLPAPHSVIFFGDRHAINRDPLGAEVELLPIRMRV